jgi:hypothetical protein
VGRDEEALPREAAGVAAPRHPPKGEVMSEDSSQNTRSLSRQEFEKDVILRTRADPAFKQQLLTDPKAAIRAAYGVDVPQEVELQVLEETPSRVYMVLPVESEELTDDELAAVAGGVGAPAQINADHMTRRMGSSASTDRQYQYK